MAENNKIFMSEFFDMPELNNNIIQTLATVATNSLQNSIGQLLSNNTDLQDDVYLGNFFEEVVPKYSDVTFRRHFMLTRDCMQILLEDLRSVVDQNHIDLMKVSLTKKVHFTLWMLANHAVSFRSASDLFGFSKGTGHLIFVEMCSAIAQLKDIYIGWPMPIKNMQNAESVLATHGFPGVIGCVDGCHIPIKAPRNNPIDFYNRKQFHSVILQGTCNNNLEFIDIYIGMPGRVHDARVFRISPLYQRIINGRIPPNQHLLGDSAYPLHLNILTPYKDNGHLTNRQKRYNTCHAASRSAIERTFGLLKGKFRRLKYLDMDLLDKIPTVICACCVLYNLKRKKQTILDSDSEKETNVADEVYYPVDRNAIELNNRQAAA